MRRSDRWVGAVCAVLFGASCSSDGDGPAAASCPPVLAASDAVVSIERAVEAVDAELGGPQAFFEVTTTAQITNVFVAVDDASAVVAYVWFDGELQAPAPREDGASGNVFSAADLDLDPSTFLATVEDDLPNTSIGAVSVVGDGDGAAYVLAGCSQAGGLLDIVVTGDGAIVSVDPVGPT